MYVWREHFNAAALFSCNTLFPQHLPGTILWESLPKCPKTGCDAAGRKVPFSCHSVMSFLKIITNIFGV